jgi:hypothetical protein
MSYPVIGEDEQVYGTVIATGIDPRAEFREMESPCCFTGKLYVVFSNNASLLTRTVPDLNFFHLLSKDSSKTPPELAATPRRLTG